MNLYYISHNLIFNHHNKCMYFENDTNLTKISFLNFKNIMSEYCWEELDFIWELELGDKYMMLDCGSNGDCLFHCISEALNLNNIYKYKQNELETEISIYDVAKLRNIASNEITNENFNFILENYKIEEEMNEFQGSWNPGNILTIDDFKNELIKCGNNFWGDHLIIQLLSKALKINFVILNNDIEDDTLSLTKVEIPSNKKYIILVYINKCHYKLLGKFDGRKMNIIFSKIPKSLDHI